MEKREIGLRDRAKKADAYIQLLNAPGWKYLKEHLEKSFMNAFETIVNGKGRPEDHAMINVIRLIYSEVGDAIALGSKAREDLVKLLKK